MSLRLHECTFIPYLAMHLVSSTVAGSKRPVSSEGTTHGAASGAHASAHSKGQCYACNIVYVINGIMFNILAKGMHVHGGDSCMY